MDFVNFASAVFGTLAVLAEEPTLLNSAPVQAMLIQLHYRSSVLCQFLLQVLC